MVNFEFVTNKSNGWPSEVPPDKATKIVLDYMATHDEINAQINQEIKNMSP